MYISLCTTVVHNISWNRVPVHWLSNATIPQNTTKSQHSHIPVDTFNHYYNLFPRPTCRWLSIHNSITQLLFQICHVYANKQTVQCQRRPLRRWQRRWQQPQQQRQRQRQQQQQQKFYGPLSGTIQVSWYQKKTFSLSHLSWSSMILYQLLPSTINCLQCFDAIGWVSGRASGL